MYYIEAGNGNLLIIKLKIISKRPQDIAENLLDLFKISMKIGKETQSAF